MVAGSILPVAFHNNQLYFLFGKENPLEDSHKGWSDFGGGVENGETPYTTAIREGGEELTGFLGDDIKGFLKKGGIYKVVHNDYHVHIFLMKYDENLPVYYNNNHSFLWKRMDRQVLNKTKLFEKIEIGWFSEESMRTQRNEFREFYREIVDKIMDKIPQIEKKMRTKIHKIENPKSKSKSKSKPKYIKNRTYKMKGGK
jgi:hypothetical protein